MKKIFSVLFILVFWGINIIPACAIEDLSDVLPESFNTGLTFFVDDNGNSNVINKFLLDEDLKLYLEIALSENFSIKVAQDRIDQYKELSKGVNSLRLPWVSISPAGNNQRTLSISSGNYKDTNLYTLPVSLDWELDLFGKNTFKYKSSKLDIKIKEEELRQAALLVSTDLEDAYYNLLLDDFLVENSAKIIKNLDETIKLKEQLYRSGIISYDDIYLTKLEYSKEIEQLNNYKIQQETFIHQITALTGSVKNTPDERGDIKTVVIPDKIKFFTPDIMLANRPDVNIKKIELDKAHIDVKQAQREFFPDIYLNELIGLSTLNFGDLFNWYSRIYTLGAQIVQDIYTGGYKKSNLNYQRNILKEKVHDYYNTVLTGSKEVEDVLSALNNDYKTYKLYEKNLADAKQFQEVIKTRFDSGISSKIDYLDSERQVYINENLYYTYKTKSINDLINLNKSLGGDVL